MRVALNQTERRCTDSILHNTVLQIGKIITESVCWLQESKYVVVPCYTPNLYVHSEINQQPHKCLNIYTHIEETSMCVLWTEFTRRPKVISSVFFALSEFLSLR